MQQVNATTIKAMGREHALYAIDQGDEMGTVAQTIASYRENLTDTLSEKGILPWETLALDAYDATVKAGSVVQLSDMTRHTLEDLAMIVGHAEAGLWEVKDAIAENDPRAEMLQKMLIQLSDLYHSLNNQ